MLSERDDLHIEAKVIGSSFAATVNAITSEGDAQRALQFLARVQKLLDADFRFELRADMRPQTTMRRKGGR